MAGAFALVHSQVQEGGQAMKPEEAMPYFLCVLLGIIIGGLCGGGTGVSQMKHEAVRAGVAYYTNDASGMAQFKWKECK